MTSLKPVSGFASNIVWTFLGGPPLNLLKYGNLGLFLLFMNQRLEPGRKYRGAIPNYEGIMGYFVQFMAKSEKHSTKPLTSHNSFGDSL